MAYTSLSGCTCQARRGLGASGDATGNVYATPVGMLQMHLNRFRGLDVPADIRFGDTKLPITGVVDMATGITAVLVAQKRAADAFARYKDNTTRDLLSTINSGFADPIGYTNANVGDLMLIAANYAQAKGRPDPATDGGGVGAMFAGTKGALLAGGLLAGVFLLWRSR